MFFRFYKEMTSSFSPQSQSHNDFEVLENTLVKPFGTLTSCRDTVHSECHRGLTLEQCIDTCRQSPFCSCGYYIEPTYDKSYCAPMNVAQLKNMNIHLNTYPLEKDPTKELWKRTAVFYRPDIYPLQGNDTTILMQKDICNLFYVYKNKSYYLQKDLAWVQDKNDDDAMRILFIDKYPQFYELANNIQTLSNFVFKIFEKPEILAIQDNELKILPYLVMSGEQLSTNMYMYIEPQDNPENPLLGQYPVLTFSTRFQIFTDEMKRFLGFQRLSGERLEMGTISYEKTTEFPGYFMVERRDIQPNIFKVANILPARLTFLKNSIENSPRGSSSTLILTILIIILMLLLILFLFFYDNILNRLSQKNNQTSDIL